MMSRPTNKFAAGVAAFLFGAGLGIGAGPATAPAMAQTAAEKAAVDAAKARGLVGEQGDGYLGFVMPSTDPALAAAVAQINSGRANVYRDIAAKTNVSLQAAGQATANELFGRLPPGQYFRPLNGNWTRK
jgi:uncharacterized protein YdbL (DUF1318 family)